MKNKLRGGPKRIDLVGDESNQSGGGRMEMMQMGENSASPSSMGSDGDAEGTDEEDGDDEDGEGSDEEEADDDGEEVSDGDGSECDDAQGSDEGESEDCEGGIIEMMMKLLILEEEGGGESEMESTREMQKSNEVNEEMTAANITHADPHNTPNMAVPHDTPNMELEQNKETEQNEEIIGANCDAVRNNQDLNNEMEVTVEERRDEENVGLKRKIDEVVQYAKGARARRKTKTALTLKSPYLTRMIDPRDNVNTFEKKFWKWVVNKQDAD
ncbi:unnamed protein product, partial [Cuscuta campestris]